jgi:preprotein translocase subunit SecG
MIKLFFVLQIILSIALTIVILLQKSSSIGLGAYSGSNESLFGARGPQGFLAKLTFILGTAFVINTITLGYLYNKTYAPQQSVFDKVEAPAGTPVPPPPPSAEQSSAPQAPAAR